MSTRTTYDYIICGAGCAGLSLAMHILAVKELKDKKILLVDSDAKNKNDRTWCFWEKETGLFESIVYQQWQHLYVHAGEAALSLDIAPYTYKLIRGIDFYDFCFHHICRHPNIEWRQARVEEAYSTGSETGIVADGIKYTAQYVFNSILFQKPVLKPHQYWMLQHFTGWFIETAQPIFDAATATLMDFRTDQTPGTCFFYALPFSSTRALIEYTVFSNQLLDKKAYAAALRQYIGQQLGIRQYAIQEEEWGVIPMSNYSFPTVKNRILHIGTAGGQTKASSGYTFRFIQKQSADMVQSLLRHGHPFAISQPARRFHFYDSILLHLLHHHQLDGAAIFSRLFLKNKAANVLSFLDNETTLLQELNIIRTLPTRPFLKAAVQQIAASLRS